MIRRKGEITREFVQDSEHILQERGEIIKIMLILSPKLCETASFWEFPALRSAGGIIPANSIRVWSPWPP